jgi:hypothetical protein
MGDRSQTTVLARYSSWKVGAWVVGSGALGVYILFDGWSHGWQPEPGSYSARYFYLAVGASPFILAIAGVLAVTFIIHQGQAITIQGEQLILNFPTGRRRISLREHLTIDAETQMIEAPVTGRLGFLKSPPVFAQQVAFYQKGKPPLVFRTGLLTESAQTIADRVREATV